MRPNLNMLVGHIAFGFRWFVTLFSTCRSFGTVHARVLKFQIWIPHGKIANPLFFFSRVTSLFGVMQDNSRTI